jgi:LysM repeat protein
MTAVLHRTSSITTTTPGTRNDVTRSPVTHSRARPYPSARPSAATYRRRRVVVGTALAVFVAVGAVTAHDVLAGSGGVPASAAVSLPAQARQRVVAQRGDTLWSIAAAHHGEISITRYVDALVDLNGGPTIQAGQEVVLP